MSKDKAFTVYCKVCAVEHKLSVPAKPYYCQSCWDNIQPEVSDQEQYVMDNPQLFEI